MQNNKKKIVKWLPLQRLLKIYQNPTLSTEHILFWLVLYPVPNSIQRIYFIDLGKKLTMSGCERLFLTNGSALSPKSFASPRAARPTVRFFAACDTKRGRK
jgi:hypothetical protein